MELSSSNIKKFLIISQSQAFLIFRETETPKKFLIFKEMYFLYFRKLYIFAKNNAKNKLADIEHRIEELYDYQIYLNYVKQKLIDVEDRSRRNNLRVDGRF